MKLETPLLNTLIVLSKSKFNKASDNSGGNFQKNVNTLVEMGYAFKTTDFYFISAAGIGYLHEHSYLPVTVYNLLIARDKTLQVLKRLDTTSLMLKNHYPAEAQSVDSFVRKTLIEI